jgi:transposase InsO family protein
VRVCGGPGWVTTQVYPEKLAIFIECHGISCYAPTSPPRRDGCTCALVLDLYSRRVVGWSMGRALGVELAVRALLMALVRGRPPWDLVLDSDRGVQYCAGAFRHH